MGCSLTSDLTNSFLVRDLSSVERTEKQVDSPMDTESDFNEHDLTPRLSRNLLVPEIIFENTYFQNWELRNWLRIFNESELLRNSSEKLKVTKRFQMNLELQLRRVFVNFPNSNSESPHVDWTDPVLLKSIQNGGVLLTKLALTSY